MTAAAVCLLLPVAGWAQVPAGPAFRVNGSTTGRQVYPALAMDAGGQFVVVWEHSPQYSMGDVFARRFAADGTAVTDELRVNEFTTAFQGAADVALDARGNAVVVWADARGDSDVFGRRVAASGVPLGSDFIVNTYTLGMEGSPAVAA